jgi:hypothetical protein
MKPTPIPLSTDQHPARVLHCARWAAAEFSAAGAPVWRDRRRFAVEAWVVMLARELTGYGEDEQRRAERLRILVGEVLRRPELRAAADRAAAAGEYVLLAIVEAVAAASVAARAELTPLASALLLDPTIGQDAAFCELAQEVKERWDTLAASTAEIGTVVREVATAALDLSREGGS